jgi:hypothetical protein
VGTLEFKCPFHVAYILDIEKSDFANQCKLLVEGWMMSPILNFKLIMPLFNEPTSIQNKIQNHLVSISCKCIQFFQNFKLVYVRKSKSECSNGIQTLFSFILMKKASNKWKYIQLWEYLVTNNNHIDSKLIKFKKS